MKHPVKAVAEERAATIAHIEAKAALIERRGFDGMDIRRVLSELCSDLRHEFHLGDA